MHENPISFFYIRTIHESSITSRHGNVQPSSLFHSHIVRDLDQFAVVYSDLFGVGSLTCSENTSFARNVIASVGDWGGGTDDSREFSTWIKRE